MEACLSEGLGLESLGKKRPHKLGWEPRSSSECREQQLKGVQDAGHSNAPPPERKLFLKKL